MKRIAPLFGALCIGLLLWGAGFVISEYQANHLPPLVGMASTYGGNPARAKQLNSTNWLVTVQKADGTWSPATTMSGMDLAMFR